MRRLSAYLPSYIYPFRPFSFNPLLDLPQHLTHPMINPRLTFGHLYISILSIHPVWIHSVSKHSIYAPFHSIYIPMCSIPFHSIYVSGCSSCLTSVSVAASSHITFPTRPLPVYHIQSIHVSLRIYLKVSRYNNLLNHQHRQCSHRHHLHRRPCHWRCCHQRLRLWRRNKQKVIHSKNELCIETKRQKWWSWWGELNKDWFHQKCHHHFYISRVLRLQGSGIEESGVARIEIHG